jgi:hypothetical protein
MDSTAGIIMHLEVHGGHSAFAGQLTSEVDELSQHMNTAAGMEQYLMVSNGLVGELGYSLKRSLPGGNLRNLPPTFVLVPGLYE